MSDIDSNPHVGSFHNYSTLKSLRGSQYLQTNRERLEESEKQLKSNAQIVFCGLIWSLKNYDIYFPRNLPCPKYVCENKQIILKTDKQCASMAINFNKKISNNTKLKCMTYFFPSVKFVTYLGQVTESQLGANFS